MDRKNLASRAAHWSATHRKTAIWGWLAFVVVAVMVGNAVGQNEIHGADDFNGESGRAEQALYDAGLRPNHENVLIQRRDADDRRSRVPGRDRGGHARGSRRPSTCGTSNRRSTAVRPVSADQHSALVEFEITGDDLEAQDRLGPSEDAIEAVQAEHPELLVEQFGNVSSNKELNDTFTEDLLQAETLSLPITLLILVIAFGIAGGGAGAAAARVHAP